MKVSLNWLKEWVSIDCPHETIAETLTMGGLEVDEVIALGDGLKGIVVAEILSAEPHPDADRLRICQVAGDSAERTVVCGAPNAKPGLKAPLATLGTTMPNGMKIKPAKLRGVASEGMLCSAVELGLGEGADAAAGLMALPDDAPVGVSLVDYLNLNDVVFDIDLTPNRSDCLSMRGIAREVAALTGATFKAPTIQSVDPITQQCVDACVDAPNDCPAYLLRVIEKVDTSVATPVWMQERLRRAGIRPISPVVDVTNYVLLELGQPMHAFDLSALSGPICVRRANQGETLSLLDGQSIDLDSECLVIADQSQVLALAGVMGGLGSGVTASTETIVLESAWFNPATIAGRARRFGLSTESSHRFERGVDPALQRLAIERATALILEIAGGNPGPISEYIDSSLPANKPVALEVKQVNAMLGTDLSADDIAKALGALGMEVDRPAEGLITAVAPSARRDINEAVDLIEEVARVIGYDQLPSHPPSGELTLSAPPEASFGESEARQHLIGRGFQEVMGWSFIPKDTLKPDGARLTGIELANPLSQEQALMRPSLMPGLVSILARNMRYGHHDQRLFEIGHCYEPQSESHHLGLVMMGHRWQEHFDAPKDMIDFYDIKDEIERVATQFQLGTLSYQATPAHPWLHPAQSAEIVLFGQNVGCIGQLHPTIAEQFGLKRGVMICEMRLDLLSQRRLPQYQPISRYQASRRDFAVVLPEKISAGELVQVIEQAAGNLLEETVIFDLYRGDGIEKGFKSLGIGLIIRDNSRTLVDQDVESVTKQVLSQLESAFGAKLRG